MTTFSAPGKVLLAGGYLVLESPNPGFVVAVQNARCYTTIQSVVTTTNDSAEETVLNIRVLSPQFQATYQYQWDYTTRTLQTMVSQSKNQLIETTIDVTLRYFLFSQPTAQPIVTHLVLVIRADNVFYQNDDDDDTPRQPTEPVFRVVGSSPTHKTGLGSSACVVTTLVAALAHVWGGTNCMARLAHVCHCLAQGKIGSGFDISAACVGTHVYQRYHCNELPSWMEQQQQQQQQQTNDSDALLYRMIHSEWTGGVVQGITWPSTLRLLLADVQGGSSSPGMASKVMQWKQANNNNDNENNPWTRLQEINTNIVQSWNDMTEFCRTQADMLVTSQYPAWKTIAPPVYHTATLFRQARQELKRMGREANVDIEPDTQTALADSTQILPGVLAAWVPGAGGHDALVVLCINHESVVEQIEECWRQSYPHVRPMKQVQAVSYGEGLRQEPTSWQAIDEVPLEAL